MKTKQDLDGLMSDTIADLLYYNRKGDEEWPRGEIEHMIAYGVVTVDEVIEMFAKHFRQGVFGK